MKSLVLSLLRTSRPVGWIASVGLFRIGLAYASAKDNWATVGLTLALSFPFCLYLFGLNDLYDLESDNVNPRKGNWIHGSKQSRLDRRLLQWAVVCSAVCVLVFVPFLPMASALIVACVMALGFIYSAPPVRLKEIPVVDGFVTAGIMIGLLGAGFASGGNLEEISVESFAVAPTLAGLHIFASVADVESDRVAGHRTLAVRAGAMVALLSSFVLSLGSLATVPFLNYATPIATYLVVQAIVIGACGLFPRVVTTHRALLVLGTSGVATILSLAVSFL